MLPAKDQGDESPLCRLAALLQMTVPVVVVDVPCKAFKPSRAAAKVPQGSGEGDEVLEGITRMGWRVVLVFLLLPGGDDGAQGGAAVATAGGVQIGLALFGVNQARDPFGISIQDAVAHAVGPVVAMFGAADVERDLKFEVVVARRRHGIGAAAGPTMQQQLEDGGGQLESYSIRGRPTG